MMMYNHFHYANKDIKFKKNKILNDIAVTT